MVKFGGKTGENGERRLIGICLSRRNTERLLDGEPILFRGEEVGVRDTDVLILAAESEAEALRQLTGAAFVAGASMEELMAALKGDLTEQ